MLGRCVALEDRVKAALPPHSLTVGVYYRMKVHQKVFHSSQYPQRGTSCSYIALTTSGQHLLLEAFVSRHNGAAFAIGKPLELLALSESFQISVCPLQVNSLLANFHHVQPGGGKNPMIAVSAIQLVSRCYLCESENFWLLRDAIEDFEHD